MELVSVPVSDVDRTNAFSIDQVGFNADHDHQVNDALRFVQLTPPGSGCSITIGTGLTTMAPGSIKGLHVVPPQGRRSTKTPIVVRIPPLAVDDRLPIRLQARLCQGSFELFGRGQLRHLLMHDVALDGHVDRARYMADVGVVVRVGGAIVVRPSEYVPDLQRWVGMPALQFVQPDQHPFIHLGREDGWLG